VARKIFEDIIEYGDVQRGLLGVMGQALDAQMAARFEVDETEGFYITDLEQGLGADLAGLKANDIIKSVDGIVINEFADLSGYLASKRPGEKVNVVFKRDGKEKSVSVRLEKINRAVFYYMEVRPLTDEQKKEYNTEHGLYISTMNNRRLYQRGIDNGYIILEVNGKKVSGLSDIKNVDKTDIEDLLFLSPSGEKKMVLMHY
jgi:S1-C subfamily serine protease